MRSRVRVLARMAVGRAVTAARASTRLAGAEVDPARADFHAILAHSLTGVFYIMDRADVGARSRSRHFHPSGSVSAPGAQQRALRVSRIRFTLSRFTPAASSSRMF